MQLLTERAHGIGHRAEVSQRCFLLRHGRFGRPSPATGSFDTALFLPLHRRHTGVLRLYRTLTVSLDASSEREETPHLALVVRFAVRLRTCLSTYGARARDALFLYIPPHECPTVAIHSHRRNRRPDVPTLHIHHMHRCFPALTPVLFVQSQRSGCRGALLVHPLLPCTPCLFHDASETFQAQIDPVQGCHASLNFAIPGMRFTHQRQNQSRKGRWLLRQQPASQRCFQYLGTRCSPTRQRLTRDTVHMTQLGDHSLFGFPHHVTDQVNALLTSAPPVPVSSPLNSDVFDMFTSPLRDSFRQFCASIVTSVHAHFESCLRRKSKRHIASNLSPKCPAFVLVCCFFRIYTFS